MWKSAARSALTALTGGGALRGAAAVDSQGLGLGRGLGVVTYYGIVVGAAAATGVRSHQQHHARNYARAAKGGKQMKRKGSTVTPQAPTNASMKAAVDKHMQTLMAAMTPAHIPKEELSEEELKEFEARAKEFSQLKMAQHRAWQVDINNKIRHKRAAIAALPAGYLRDAAMVEDHAMFPLVGSGEVGLQGMNLKGQISRDDLVVARALFNLTGNQVILHHNE